VARMHFLFCLEICLKGYRNGCEMRLIGYKVKGGFMRKSIDDFLLHVLIVGFPWFF